jgi:hypothetical protein
MRACSTDVPVSDMPPPAPLNLPTMHSPLAGLLRGQPQV